MRNVAALGGVGQHGRGQQPHRRMIVLALVLDRVAQGRELLATRQHDGFVELLALAVGFRRAVASRAQRRRGFRVPKIGRDGTEALRTGLLIR